MNAVLIVGSESYRIVVRDVWESRLSCVVGVRVVVTLCAQPTSPNMAIIRRTARRSCVMSMSTRDFTWTPLNKRGCSQDRNSSRSASVSTSHRFAISLQCLWRYAKTGSNALFLELSVKTCRGMKKQEEHTKIPRNKKSPKSSMHSHWYSSDAQ